jgi:hypothetical protein
MPATARICAGRTDGAQALPSRNGISVGASTISETSSGKMIAACTRVARSCNARSCARLSVREYTGKASCIITRLSLSW